MAILGIDYGDKRIGLSIAQGSLAEPLETVANKEDLFKRLGSLCKKRKVKKIILGLPDRQQGEKVRVFARRLKKSVDIPIIFWDETFTSKQAQRIAINSGKKRKGRKALDSIAASIILQEYLDSL